MTEEQQIQAAIDQQFKQYQDANAPAVVASSPVAAEPTISSNPYAALSEAAASHEIAAEKGKSHIPGVETAKSIHNQLPEDMQPLATAAAGYVGGKALRSILPQASVYGTPEYRATETAQANAVTAGEQHRAQNEAFKAQHGAAQQAHAANLAELERAHTQNAYAQTLTPEGELARRSNVALPPTKGGLTMQPRGGEGTANYGEKFGLTHPEAQKASSMSAIQQENIPAQQKAWNTISRIEPSFESIKESPLLLGPEGQKAVSERLAQQRAMEAAAGAEAERAHKQMALDVARHKAEVQFKLDKAREAAHQSQKSAAIAAKELAAHNAMVPPAPEPIRTGPLRTLAKIGAKVAPRFIPGAGAAFAPIEAEAALQDWQAQNYGRAAIHGLGSLGALAQGTGVPWAMGAGDIAQLPAAGLSLYDMLNQKTGQ